MWSDWHVARNRCAGTAAHSTRLPRYSNASGPLLIRDGMDWHGLDRPCRPQKTPLLGLPLSDDDKQRGALKSLELVGSTAQLREDNRICIWLEDVWSER